MTNQYHYIIIYKLYAALTVVFRPEPAGEQSTSLSIRSPVVHGPPVSSLCLSGSDCRAQLLSFPIQTHPKGQFSPYLKAYPSSRAPSPKGTPLLCVCQSTQSSLARPPIGRTFLSNFLRLLLRHIFTTPLAFFTYSLFFAPGRTAPHFHSGSR